MTPRPRYWVTRTAPGAAETARRLEVLGLEPVVQPVLELAPILGVVLDLTGIGAIAFTSRNAVQTFAALTPRRDFTAFAVGEATAGVARDAGFTDVRSADGDVEALAAQIAASSPQGIVLHPSAAEPAGDLAGALAEAGVAVRSIAVYEAVECGGSAPDNLAAVVIHSPRGGGIAAAKLSGRDHLQIFTISEAAAEPFIRFNFQAVAVAPYPNEAALLKLIEDHVSQP